MRFEAEPHSDGGVEAADARATGLVLGRFAPPPGPSSSAWVHSIRHLDRAGRVSLPEAAELGPGATARLCGHRWEITGSRPRSGATPMMADRRSRVLVPAGIRQQLGLLDLAVVSTALSLGRVVLWAPANLDRFLEEP